jgi:hypothetical protein
VLRSRERTIMAHGIRSRYYFLQADHN